MTSKVLYNQKDTQTDSEEGAVEGVGTTGSSASTGTTSGANTGTNPTSFSRLRLFMPKEKSPAEQLEILMSRAFLVWPKEIIFNLIVKLLEKNKDLACYVSKNYQCNPLELALRLNNAKALNGHIEALHTLGCVVRPEYSHLLLEKEAPRHSLRVC